MNKEIKKSLFPTIHDRLNDFDYREGGYYIPMAPGDLQILWTNPDNNPHGYVEHCSIYDKVGNEILIGSNNPKEIEKIIKQYL